MKRAASLTIGRVRPARGPSVADWPRLRIRRTRNPVLTNDLHGLPATPGHNTRSVAHAVNRLTRPVTGTEQPGPGRLIRAGGIFAAAQRLPDRRRVPAGEAAAARQRGLGPGRARPGLIPARHHRPA